MQIASLPGPVSRRAARFGGRGEAREFLDQVRLWNRVEGLPPIEVTPLLDGLSVQISSAEGRYENIRRLVEAFGGVAIEPW
jgi:hypothetical protein